MANYIPEFTLADRLRKAREVTGMTIKEFAALSGISDTSVTNYEHGYRSPRRIYLEKWAEVSGVDLFWLLTGEAPAFAGASQGLARPKGLEPPTFCMGAEPWTADDDAALQGFIESTAVR